VTSDPDEVANAWAVMQAAELAASSDELALLATWEAMRLMLVSDNEARRRKGREGLRGLLQVTLDALREHDPDELTRLVEHWRPTAEANGLEW
jgi:hypothetical protein